MSGSSSLWHGNRPSASTATTEFESLYDGFVTEENRLLFVGDNGTCENGLQRMSTSDVVKTIQRARNMRLIVLNACSTSMLAEAIIENCRHVNYVISWNTASHKEACEIFGEALAKYLKSDPVPLAFRRAKLSVRLTQETGKMKGVPVGMSRFVEHDPNSSDVDQKTGRIRSEHGLSPIAAGIPYLYKRGGSEVSPLVHRRKRKNVPGADTHILITACSYEFLSGIIPPLLGVVNEANAIQTNMYPTSCVKHINPNVQTVADSIVECNVWFFLGHGDGSVREENYLLFVGDNGRCENGLQSMSTSEVVEMIQCARDMRLIVLNACSTFMLAEAIIEKCKHVNYVISWNTVSHSGACEIFGQALAKYLKSDPVPLAFNRARLSMMRPQTGKRRQFMEHDPQSPDIDKKTGRIRSEHGLSPMAAGIPFLHKRGGPEV